MVKCSTLMRLLLVVGSCRSELHLIAKIMIICANVRHTTMSHAVHDVPESSVLWDNTLSKNSNYDRKSMPLSPSVRVLSYDV